MDTAVGAEAPNFTAGDAAAVLCCATLPQLRRKLLESTTNSSRVEVAVESVSYLPSYDDKNWLIKAKLVPSTQIETAPTSSREFENSPATITDQTSNSSSLEFSIVMKASRITPPERTKAHVAMMHALARHHVPVPEVIELGHPSQFQASSTMGTTEREDVGKKGKVIRAGNGIVEQVSSYVWTWTELTSTGQLGNVASIFALDYITNCCDWESIPDRRLRVNRSQLYKVGSVIGKLSAVFNEPNGCGSDPVVINGLRRPATQGSHGLRPEGYFVWDTRCVLTSAVENFPYISQYTKSLVEQPLLEFERIVHPLTRQVPPSAIDGPCESEEAGKEEKKAYLPWGLVHGDLNDCNVLAYPSGEVAALVDFSDCVFTHTVFEIGNSVCYFLQLAIQEIVPQLIDLVPNLLTKSTKTEAQSFEGTQNEKEKKEETELFEKEAMMKKVWEVIDCGCNALVEGFFDMVPLSADEITCLVPAALARTAMCVSASEASVSIRSDIDADYVLKDSVGGRAVLRLFASPVDVPLAVAWEPRLGVAEVISQLRATLLQRETRT